MDSVGRAARCRRLNKTAGRLCRFHAVRRMEKRRTTVSVKRESQREGWEAKDEAAVLEACEAKWRELSWLCQHYLQGERGTNNRYWEVNSKSKRKMNE